MDTLTLDVQEINIDDIDVDEEFNFRGYINPSTCVELAVDIRDRGLLSPVLVRANTNPKKLFHGKKYSLQAGFRRYTAFVINQTKTIPANIQYDVNDYDARCNNLRENLNRQDLTILQEAHALQILKKSSMSMRELGQKFGQSAGWVQVRLDLLKLDEDIQKEADKGTLTQVQIRQLVHMPAEKRAEQVRKIKEHKEKGEQIRKDVVAKKNPFKGKLRNVGGIREMQDYLRSLSPTRKFADLPPELSFATFVLGWAAGENSDFEVYREIKKIMGDAYTIPDVGEKENGQKQEEEKELQTVSSGDGFTES